MYGTCCMSQVCVACACMFSPSVSGAVACEATLVRDLIFVFQGINGVLLKFNEKADAFRVDPKVRGSCRQLFLVTFSTRLPLYLFVCSELSGWRIFGNATG